MTEAATQTRSKSQDKTTKFASIMTAGDVPLATGDILRTTKTPAVAPPSGNTLGHRRSSSSAAEAAGINLEAIGVAVARKVMSEEHKILGFRPPPGSFAAELQAAAAKHPEGNAAHAPDPEKLKEIAREDALRILAERGAEPGSSPPKSPKMRRESVNKRASLTRHSPPAPGVDITAISPEDARTLMSLEHRALGFRPPTGSLAAEAQSAASKQSDGRMTHLDEATLKEIVLCDAERIKADRELDLVGKVNVSTIGKEAAQAIQSAEAKALGHRPPPGSLAAHAQSAGDKYPEGGSFPPGAVEIEQMTEEARKEGERLKQKEAVNASEMTTTVEVRRPEHVVVAVKPEDAPTDPAEKPLSPPFSRTETADSVEIVGDVLP